jgi:hypothetical protein
LRFNNKKVPDLRSKELWEDNIYSKVIFDDFKPLDILFLTQKLNIIEHIFEFIYEIIKYCIFQKIFDIQLFGNLNILKI